MFRDFSRKLSAEVRVPRPLAAALVQAQTPAWAAPPTSADEGLDDDDAAATLDQRRFGFDVGIL